MDKLKQFIDKNRDEFDDFSLPDGHLDRFRQKLPSSPRRYTMLYALGGIVAAACIAMLFFFRPPVEPLNGNDGDYSAECEIEELHLYYTMQMNDLVARMETICEKDQTPGSSLLLEETQRVLEDSHEFEADILPTLPCSEEGLFVMNQHYGNSLESLHIMLEQLERVVKTEDTYQ